MICTKCGKEHVDDCKDVDLMTHDGLVAGFTPQQLEFLAKWFKIQSSDPIARIMGW